MGRAYDNYWARSGLKDQVAALKNQAIGRRASWYEENGLGGGVTLKPMEATMSAAYDHVYEIDPPGAQPMYDLQERQAIADLTERISRFPTPWGGQPVSLQPTSAQFRSPPEAPPVTSPRLFTDASSPMPGFMGGETIPAGPLGSATGQSAPLFGATTPVGATQPLAAGTQTPPQLAFSALSSVGGQTSPVFTDSEWGTTLAANGSGSIAEKGINAPSQEGFSQVQQPQGVPREHVFSGMEMKGIWGIPLEEKSCNEMSEGGFHEDMCMMVAKERRQLEEASRRYEDQDLSTPPPYGFEETDKDFRRVQKMVKDSPFDGVIKWINEVRPGGKNDFKVVDDDDPEHTDSEREEEGNFNYGATCIAAGFHPDVCLRAGGLVQGITDVTSGKGWFPNSGEGRPWDDPTSKSCYGEPEEDCDAVRKGISYGLKLLKRDSE
ncbi:MAG: hypothetical protein HQL59_10340 [Magnetococcales bacterium]|nr:hypothetical protein [Magnetococcales bacterium]